MQLPILINHDHTRPPIGFVLEKDGAFFVEFTSDVKITKELAFNIFGGAGLHILEATEENGVFLIRKARIIEFSMTPCAATVPNVELTGAARLYRAASSDQRERG